MSVTEHQTTVARQGAADAGQYFSYMADYVGFSGKDAEMVKQTKPIIEKHLPEIVTKFYEHLLRYPPTRKYFIKKDGTVDEDYLELRMRHLTNFWLRTADGVFDEDYARYVDYVGRAHTSRGADPHIYIAERYVIGQVGMMQHAINEAIGKELKDSAPQIEELAADAWGKLMMVILEMLSRAYGEERQPMTFDPLVEVDERELVRLADEAVEHEEGLGRKAPTKNVAVADVADLPDGSRKIVMVDHLSIGIFHHKGGWYALRSSCVHRGGPVATGALQGDILTCPWHGFQYNVTNGQCLADPSARLDMYPVTLSEGKVYIAMPDLSAQPAATRPAQAAAPAALKPNEFHTGDIKPGAIGKVEVDGKEVAVFNVGGTFYATQNDCTHRQGPLNQGDLDGKIVTCFVHGSQFDVTTGKVVLDPASEPLRVYKVTVDGDIGHVEAGT